MKKSGTLPFTPACSQHDVPVARSPLEATVLIRGIHWQGATCSCVKSHFHGQVGSHYSLHMCIVIKKYMDGSLGRGCAENIGAEEYLFYT